MVTLEELDEEALVEILTKPKNALVNSIKNYLLWRMWIWNLTKKLYE